MDLNFSFFFSNFPELTITGLAFGAIYALIALGYTMVYGVLQLINFAHSEVFMYGTFATLWVVMALNGVEADGIDNREDLLAWVNEYDEQGITKQLKFDEAGEPADVHVYAYSVEGGEIVSDQEIE